MKKVVWLLMTVLLLGLLMSSAYATIITIPAGVTEIDDEAFYGNACIEEVILPEGTKKIGDRAFAQSGLKKINLPDSIESFGINVFGDNPDLVVKANPGTSAYQWAVRFGYINNLEFANIESCDLNETCNKSIETAGEKIWFSFMPDETAYYKWVVTNNEVTPFIECYVYDEDLNMLSYEKQITPMIFGISSTLELIAGHTYYFKTGYISAESIGNISFGVSKYSGFLSAEAEKSSVLVMYDSIATLKVNTIAQGIEVYYSWYKVLPEEEEEESNGTLQPLPVGWTTTAIYGVPSNWSRISDESSNELRIESIRQDSEYYCQITTNEGYIRIGDVMRPRVVNVRFLVNIAEDDGFDYYIEDDIYCIVTGYHGSSSDLIIPEKCPDGHVVRTVADRAFYQRSDLTGLVIIPETVVSVGNEAFSGCSGLTGNLVIPDSVRSIGDSAFEGCSSLTGTLSLGSSLESIGSSAFSNAGFTGNLVFPASLRSIGSSAFYSCRGFTGTLTVPRTISVVNDAVFSECTGFDGNLIIEDGITSIGDSSFACKYPNNFKGNLVIPDSVTSIGQSAFRGCGCNGTLTISQNVTEIQRQTFFFSRFTGSLSIPYGVTSIGAGAFGMTVFTGTLSLPETLICIGGEAFCGQQNERPFVGSLSIPNSVTTLGAMSFGYCGFDGHLTLSRSITVVPSACFVSCSFTGKLYIPANIKRIESSAFSGNCFTGDLFIPDTVVYATGFSGCTFDGNLVISKNMTEIPSSAFFGCNRLKGSIIVPEGISTIGASAFSGCFGFDGELSLPDSLTTIGDSAFKDCSGLGGNIIIPKNVTKISWNAFNECSGINGYIYVGRSVTTINGKPFSGTNPVKFLLDNNSYAHLNASKHGLVPYQVMDELNLTLNIFAGTEVDDPITADCVVSGGLAPYMYKYEVNISDGSYYYTGWRTNKTSSFYPVTDGYYTFTVTVRDSLGNTVTKTNGNVYRHLHTEGESNARENVYFARYMNNFFFNDIPEPQAIQGYWYFSLHDDYYPWVVEFIEYLSKFSPTNPSYYIDIYNNLFNQEDKKDFLLEKALVMCSTGNDFKMYELMSMPDGIKTLNSFTKLMSVNDNTGFINILHDVTGNSDSLLDNVFNSYCNDYIGSDDLPAALNGIVANSDDRTYTANSMRLLKDFKTFKDLAGTYGVMKAVYDDMVVDVLNTLALFDTVDMGQLYSLASTWEVTGDSAQKEVGRLLKSLAGVNREDRLALLLGRNGYRSIVKCFGKLLDTGSGKLIKLSKKSGSEYSSGLAVYGIITSVLELGAGQESYADKFQELETSTEIVNAAWNDFIVRRGEYSNNPSEENFEHVIYACINYLQSAAVSETTFVALVAEARQHIILQWAGFGQPMLEAAEHSSDHAAALNTFVNSIRQYYKNWKAIDNYDYSIVKSQFSNALSTYKQWSYESYANNSGVNGGW